MPSKKQAENTSSKTRKKKVSVEFPHLLLQHGKIHQQFYQALKQQILTGQVRPGSKLPSSRSLAEMMSISRNSVLAGFDRLIDEGYLVSRAGSGTYVAQHIPDELIDSVKTPTPTPQTTTELPLQLNPQMQLLDNLWNKVVPRPNSQQIFSIGVGCNDLFPEQLWGRLLGRAWRHYRHWSPLSQDAFGFEPLRQSIAQYVSTTRGLNCDASQILIVNGTQQAMNLTAKVLLQQGDEVCLDEPGYDGALGVFQAAGATVHPVKGDQHGMDIEAAIQHYPQTKLLFTAPSHQYPLGGTLSLQRRLLLLDWAAKQQLWIFEDDYNSEFRYNARPIQALQGLDQHQRVIYAGTFSKMMYPEFRLGFLVVPPQLIHAFKLAKHYADTRTGYLEQAALHLFIAEGHYARHVRRVRKACYERQQSLITALQQYLPQFKIQVDDSGIHLICYLPQGMTEQQIIEHCQEYDLGLQPLSRYRQVASTEQALLLGFAAHPKAQLIEAVKRLKCIVDKIETANA
ncbi:PLP-dependent aminotransferase family protein [Acinetobacter rudis]|uniref:MocR-like pyridoxine biosynthesis transcription factor PdxR n=1 Tax=Acinetobacter rudis TaxID=632955 RepID=UPI00280D331E|nr:PLP-dependent aminotransferase family protein [Acinetobacter rudis]MDQ8954019.1 PLP-dependent aminotransferase family protein [Acinetobacter rudis]